MRLILVKKPLQFLTRVALLPVKMATKKCDNVYRHSSAVRIYNCFISEGYETKQIKFFIFFDIGRKIQLCTVFESDRLTR